MRSFTSLCFALFTLSCATATSAGREVGEGVPFVEDDYPKALEAAKGRGVPLFVDAWAPWCHSCVFMREHVLNSPQLAREGSRYVFLSLDTEKEKSASFLERYPIDTWPTLLIIDPQTQTPVLKWLGTLTAEQFTRLLDDGAAAMKAQGNDEPTVLLAEADRLYAERKSTEAAAAYRAALVKMPARAPRRARTVESLLNALYSSQQLEACAQVASAEAPGLPKGPSLVNSVVWGLSCATSASEGGWRKPAIAALEAQGQLALNVEGVLADDRSGLYEELVSLREEAGDGPGQKKLAAAWLTFLEGEAGKATTAAARAVFDPHRLSAAMAMGEPLRVEAALKQSEKDLSDDYNPPARLAVMYRELGRFDEGLAAADRALARAYGPRKLRVYETKASLFAKQGNQVARLAVLTEAIAYGQALPASQRPAKTLARLLSQLQ